MSSGGSPPTSMGHGLRDASRGTFPRTSCSPSCLKAKPTTTAESLWAAEVLCAAACMLRSCPCAEESGCHEDISGAV